MRNRAARYAALTIAGVVALVRVPDALAQGNLRASRLTLDDALQVAFGANARIQIAERQLAAHRGFRLQASAPFDAVLHSAVATERDNTLVPAQQQASASSFATDAVTYRLDLERQSRAGVIGATELRLSQVRVAGVPDVPVGRASAALRLTVPLSYDRGGAVSRAPEQVAALQVQGGEHDLKHATAVAARETVAAYWDYVAAHVRLQIAETAEERGQRLVTETELLVQAAERPASDLTQLFANLAFKRASRVAAQQRFIEAREQLGLTMGLPGAAIGQLPLPATNLPSLDSLPASPSPNAARWQALADSHRDDLQAARARLSAGRVAFAGAQDELEARLDLSVSVGFAGLVQRRGVNGFVSPLHQNVKGPNASVQLQYRRSLLNSDARGRLVQHESRLAQQRVATADLQRHIASSVETVMHALTNSALGLDASERAVRLYRETVENERRKFQLGTSTLFDVLLAEDALTNALLGEIASRRAYVGAILDVRFATGSLVSREQGSVPRVQALHVPDQ